MQDGKACQTEAWKAFHKIDCQFNQAEKSQAQNRSHTLKHQSEAAGQKFSKADEPAYASRDLTRWASTVSVWPSFSPTARNDEEHSLLSDTWQSAAGGSLSLSFTGRTPESSAYNPLRSFSSDHGRLSPRHFSTFPAQKYGSNGLRHHAIERWASLFGHVRAC